MLTLSTIFNTRGFARCHVICCPNYQHFLPRKKFRVNRQTSPNSLSNRSSWCIFLPILLPWRGDPRTCPINNNDRSFLSAILHSLCCFNFLRRPMRFPWLGFALSIIASQTLGYGRHFPFGKIEVVVWALRSETEVPEEETGLWKWGFLMLLIYICLTY